MTTSHANSGEGPGMDAQALPARNESDGRNRRNSQSSRPRLTLVPAPDDDLVCTIERPDPTLGRPAAPNEVTPRRPPTARPAGSLAIAIVANLWLATSWIPLPAALRIGPHLDWFGGDTVMMASAAHGVLNVCAALLVGCEIAQIRSRTTRANRLDCPDALARLEARR